MDNPHAQANLSYLAGMIDGDGTVLLSLKNTRYKETTYRVITPIVQLANSNPVVTNYCLAEIEKLGVKANTFINTKTGAKPSHCIIIVGQNRCRRVLEGIAKFLIEKKKRAEVALQFIQYRNKSSRDYSEKDWQYYSSMQEAKKDHGTMPKCIDWDYIGGLFDAEGCISLAGGNPKKNGQYRAIVPKVSLANTNRVLADYYREAVLSLGINPHLICTEKPSGKIYHSVDICSISKAKILLEKLKEHIVAKTERAFIALEFINHRLALSSQGVPKRRYTSYEFGLRDKVLAMNG